MSEIKIVKKRIEKNIKEIKSMILWYEKHIESQEEQLEEHEEALKALKDME